MCTIVYSDRMMSNALDNPFPIYILTSRDDGYNGDKHSVKSKDIFGSSRENCQHRIWCAVLRFPGGGSEGTGFSRAF